MTPKQKRESWTLAIMGLIFSAISMSITFVPEKLWGGVISAAVITSVTFLLVQERVNTANLIASMKEDLATRIRDSNVFKGAIIKFDDEEEAINYVGSVCGDAESIYNTRLEPNATSDNPDTFAGQISLMDSKIIDAIIDGANYYLVFDTSHKAEIGKFGASLSKARKRHGKAVLYEIDAAAKPLMQMFVFEFRNQKKECLVGWQMGNNRQSRNKVMSFTDHNVVEFFRDTFERYLAEPINVTIIDKRL